MNHRRGWYFVSLFGAMGLTAALVPAGIPSAAAAPTADVFFSEYIEGTSNNKALEIANGTGAAVDLAAGGYVVQMYFNGAATAGTTINLTGSVAANDVFVVADNDASATILAVTDQQSTASFFNGDDAIVLRKGGATGPIVDSIGQVGVDPGSEWGAGLASTADNTLRRRSSISAADTDPGNAFDPAVEWDGFATDTFDNLGSYQFGDTGTPTATPPAPTPTPTPVCDLNATPIGEVQGSGEASPKVGSTVTIRGAVTGDFQGGSGLNGFFLQDTGDNDAATSDGVFVFIPSANPLASIDVAVSDLVALTGTVKEFNGLTEIDTVSALNICGTAAPVAPLVVELPEPTNGYLERYEGMLVTFPETLTVGQTFFLGRYGQLTLSSEGRLFQPTNFIDAQNQAAVQAQADENQRRLLVLDDGRSSQNPNPIPYIGADGTLRAGDTTSGLTGVLDFGPINSNSSIRDYRVQPTQPVSFTRANPRTAAPEPVGGNVKIASFNLLNYFNGDGLGGGFPTSRGANTATEFSRQRAKIIAAITALDADVIGLVEMENDGNGPNSSVQDLVNGLNAAAGAETYATTAIPTGDPNPDPQLLGTDEIRVALIYKPGRVTPVGAPATSGDTVFSRPPLAQTFKLNSNGALFTPIVNHFKSKGSCPASPSDPNADQGDGQGCWNVLRVQQAQALLAFEQSVTAQAGDSDALIIGDLNSYAEEDPVDVLRDGGYVDQLARYNAQPYSYVFDGQAGYIDHGLVSATLNEQATGANTWHINADEPSVIDYNTEFKPQDLYTPTPYRSSDHDPVVIGLNLLNYNFNGFAAPIANPPTFNFDKAGRTIPVKFSLDQNYGLNIFADGYPKSQPITCDTATPTGPAEPTQSANRVGLAYDPSTNTYVYPWKTEKSWQGTCRKLIVQLDDGTIRQAYFNFAR